jgi:hypothetical protein
MPRGDGTGPLGLGPMTGRGMGYCAGFPVPRYINPRWGFRRGRGFRRMYWLTGFPGWTAYGYPYAGTVDEKTILENQRDFLKSQLEAIESELNKTEENK